MRRGVVERWLSQLLLRQTSTPQLLHTAREGDRHGRSLLCEREQPPRVRRGLLTEWSDGALAARVRRQGLDREAPPQVMLHDITTKGCTIKSVKLRAFSVSIAAVLMAVSTSVASAEPDAPDRVLRLDDPVAKDQRVDELILEARLDGVRLVESDVIVKDVALGGPETGDVTVHGVGTSDMTFSLDDEGSVQVAFEEDPFEHERMMAGPGWAWPSIAQGAHSYTEHRTLHPSSREIDWGCRSVRVRLGIVRWNWTKRQGDRSEDRDPNKDYFVYEHTATASPRRPVSLSGCTVQRSFAASRVYVRSVPTSRTISRGWQRVDVSPLGSQRVACDSNVRLSVGFPGTSLSTVFNGCDDIDGNFKKPSGAHAKSKNRWSEQWGQPRRIALQLAGTMPQGQIMYASDFGAVRWVIADGFGQDIDCDTSEDGGWCP